jgi:hypothetical protein
MAEEIDSAQTEKKTEVSPQAVASSANSGIQQPTAKQKTVPNPRVSDSDAQPEIPEEVSVRIIRDEGLTPFEAQTILIAQRTLAVSQGSYTFARIGFWVAFGAAVIIGTQVYEMTTQTQILASQTESAVAAGLMEEMNTRKQLDIAQKQAEAAQESAEAIQGQMRTDQRPWLYIPRGSEKTEPYILGQEITDDLYIVNSGKTLARNVMTTFRIHMLLKGEEPDFNYHDHFFPPVISKMGTIFPNESPRLLRVAVVSTVGGKKMRVTLPQRDFDSLAKGEEHAVIYGTIGYDDTFGHHHWTHYCGGIILEQAFPNSPSKRCVEYNDADHNN